MKKFFQHYIEWKTQVIKQFLYYDLNGKNDI